MFVYFISYYINIALSRFSKIYKIILLKNNTVEFVCKADLSEFKSLKFVLALIIEEGPKFRPWDIPLKF